MNHVEARLLSQNYSTVLVVLMEIWSAAFSKTIIDTEIYDNASEYFVERVLEVCKKIVQKKSPSACST